LPPFLAAINTLERFHTEEPTIAFLSLEETDSDSDFVRSALAPNAQCSVLLRRWTDPFRAEEFFHSLATLSIPSACRIIVKDSEYFGSALIDGNTGIYHALDVAKWDGDTASFILGDRKSCFYVDIVDDFDFVGIEAKFWGEIVRCVSALPIDHQEIS